MRGRWRRLGGERWELLAALLVFLILALADLLLPGMHNDEGLHGLAAGYVLAPESAAGSRIVINQFQARASLPQQIINELREEGLPVLASFLSTSVKIKESHQQAKPMIHLDRNHKLALEFGALFDELQAAKKARAKAAAKKRA